MIHPRLRDSSGSISTAYSFRRLILDGISPNQQIGKCWETMRLNISRQGAVDQQSTNFNQTLTVIIARVVSEGRPNIIAPRHWPPNDPHKAMLDLANLHCPGETRQKLIRLSPSDTGRTGFLRRCCRPDATAATTLKLSIALGDYHSRSPTLNPPREVQRQVEWTISSRSSERRIGHLLADAMDAPLPAGANDDRIASRSVGTLDIDPRNRGSLVAEHRRSNPQPRDR